MTTRQQTLLEDLATALTAAARDAHAAGSPEARAERWAEALRLTRVKIAAESLVACAGSAAHWTEDEREGLMYLRRALYGTAP